MSFPRLDLPIHKMGTKRLSRVVVMSCMVPGSMTCSSLEMAPRGICPLEPPWPSEVLLLDPCVSFSSLSPAHSQLLCYTCHFTIPCHGPLPRPALPPRFPLTFHSAHQSCPSPLSQFPSFHGPTASQARAPSFPWNHPQGCPRPLNYKDGKECYHSAFSLCDNP